MKTGILYIGVIEFVCILSIFVDTGEIHHNRSKHNVAGHLFHENSFR